MLARKYKIIIALLEMFDANAGMDQKIKKLERENQDLRRKLSMTRAGDEKPVSGGHELLDQKAMEIGRRKIYEDATPYGLGNITLTRSEDDPAVYEPTPFEEWREERVRAHFIPTYVSADDFYDYFDDMIRAEYDRKVNEAMIRKIADKPEE